jgi:hypothetical protein
MHGQREKRRDLKWSDRTNGVWREPSEPAKTSAAFRRDSILFVETGIAVAQEVTLDLQKREGFEEARLGLQQIHENCGGCSRCGMRRACWFNFQSPNPPIWQAQRPAATQNRPFAAQFCSICSKKHAVRWCETRAFSERTVLQDRQRQ